MCISVLIPVDVSKRFPLGLHINNKQKEKSQKNNTEKTN